MFCNKCGSEIANNTQICPQCGNLINYGQKKKEKKILPILLACIAVVLLIIIGLLVLLFVNKKEVNEFEPIKTFDEENVMDEEGSVNVEKSNADEDRTADENSIVNEDDIANEDSAENEAVAVENTATDKEYVFGYDKDAYLNAYRKIMQDIEAELGVETSYRFAIIPMHGPSDNDPDEPILAVETGMGEKYFVFFNEYTKDGFKYGFNQRSTIYINFEKGYFIEDYWGGMDTGEEISIYWFDYSYISADHYLIASRYDDNGNVAHYEITNALGDRFEPLDYVTAKEYILDAFGEGVLGFSDENKYIYVEGGETYTDWEWFDTYAEALNKYF